MNRPILFSLLLAGAAIAGAADTTRAQCIANDGNLTLQRSAPPSDDTFATSGPASSNTDFKFELELGSDLDIFANDTDTEAATTDTAETTTDASTTPSPAAQSADSPTIFSLDTDSSSAADLNAVELGEPTLISREDYLDSRASEINSCF